LQLEWNITDLIEKDGSLVRQFKPPDPSRDRSGKGCPL